MSWLRLRRQGGLLGVDLGAAQIKVAVIKGGRLVAKGAVPTPAGGWDNETEMVAALAEAVQQSGWRGRQAVSAISGERVIVRYLRFPRMPEKELRAGLQYEAERYLPMGTQDMVLDCAILEEHGSGQKDMPVLLAAAPKEQAMKYYHIFQGAGLELVALDLIPAALCRALAGLGDKKQEVIILDLGERWTQVVLVRGKELLFSRAVGIGSKELVQGASPLGFNRLGDLVQEIRRTLDFYRSQGGSGFTPRQVWLTGGGAYQEGLKDYLHLELDMPVEIALPYFLGPEFAVAVGLALRER